MKKFTFVLATLAACRSAAAGPVDPPAGPVTATGKTLTEIEPRRIINSTNTPGDADSVFRITQSGNYYLTGNVQGVNAKYGIEVAASNVTIDLNGFELIGVPGAFSGITPTAMNLRNIIVQNGTVRNWPIDGVNLAGGAGLGSATGCRITDVRSLSNGFTALVVSTGGMISRCLTSGNGAGVLDEASIEGGTGSTISDCVAYSNSGNGFFVSRGTIQNCTAYNNVHGIDVTFGTVTGCTAFDNSGSGFNLSGSTATSCTARDNSVYGFNGSSQSTIAHCTATVNASGGIALSGGCTLRDSAGNGSRGVYIPGNDNRVSGCTITGQTGAGNIGLHITGLRNTFVQNSLSGNNTNAIASEANNIIGPYITGFGFVSTSNPWANFTN